MVRHRVIAGSSGFLWLSTDVHNHVDIAGARSIWEVRVSSGLPSSSPLSDGDAALHVLQRLPRARMGEVDWFDSCHSDASRMEFHGKLSARPG